MHPIIRASIGGVARTSSLIVAWTRRLHAVDGGDLWQPDQALQPRARRQVRGDHSVRCRSCRTIEGLRYGAFFSQRPDAATRRAAARVEPGEAWLNTKGPFRSSRL